MFFWHSCDGYTHMRQELCCPSVQEKREKCKKGGKNSQMSPDESLLCLHAQDISMEKYSVGYVGDLKPGEVCNESG